LKASPGRDRILFAALLGLVAALAVFARLVTVQVFAHERFEARAEQNQEGRVLLPPRRGELLDRKGRVLASDLRTYSVHAVPRIMKNPRATAKKLARLLDLNTSTLIREFKKRPKFCWVSRQLDPGLETELQEAGLRGVYLNVEIRREYSEPACVGVTGRVNLDGKGVEGIEYQFESVLHGRSGWETVYKDGSGGKVFLPRGSRRDPEHGHGLVLTIDSSIQGVVMSRLGAAVERTGARQGTAVVLDPYSGEILGMGSCGPATKGVKRNPVMSDTYEPGSTFKLVAASATLDEDLADTETIYNAEDGSYNFGGFLIHDTHEYGEITLFDAVRFSSNIVAGKLAVELGERKFYQYATAYGFGSLTGVEFPGEAGGRLRPPHQWSGRSLPTLAIGQEVSVTPLQMALSYAVLANGGLLMTPQLVLAELDPHGKVVRRFKPHAVRRVISAETATVMREMMQAVVDSGTAKRARIDWAHVGGKTGTAQKYDPASGTYSRAKYVSSFVGFLPADDPRLVCLVLIDEPGRGYYGGEVAAPVFREIVEDIRRMRRGPLSPTPERVLVDPEDVRPPPTVVPDVRLLPIDEASRLLAEMGLRVRAQGEGTRVVAQSPVSGIPIDRGEVVELVLDMGATGVMPRVVGLTVRQALAELSARGIRPQVVGSGVVRKQAPAAGAKLPRERRCVLRCEPLDVSYYTSSTGGSHGGR
jgi:cell division protein FtsI (penicillin-binding protein 3)